MNCFWQATKVPLWKQSGESKVATAPSLTDDDDEVTVSTSVPRDVTARGLHSECVVCQDAEVSFSKTILVIFFQFY